ncbi:MAG: hypothetical protein B7Z58_14390 [Acidiphilium sp. 37-64-53]|uniref:colicin E3/pyocin S6 family cytotoxin n=1 Tax=Acidiphilium TaxID=522 RepID=UPI000BD2720D|nr:MULTISPECIES: colicin E3/pyocin S6 family cytotoxin [Acidiphilium]OYW00709.1 MAG: hypothetical protein B7Z58_14390 [Acidiphilium sp. 37-64-53]OZB26311.1 MAG: hypothetical protein B7X49_12770 [Acidiphilium sp. 34-64-41]HQT86446.1 colicin E3/pyocin S6 family cytotoxin [Acidiphilium rubrum]
MSGVLPGAELGGEVGAFAGPVGALAGMVIGGLVGLGATVLAAKAVTNANDKADKGLKAKATQPTSTCSDAKNPDHGYVPAPNDLPAYPDAKKAKRKTPKKGGGKRKRWKDKSGKIYEWDYQHGKVEKYDPKGRHLGEFDPDTGEQTKPADPKRLVEP